MHGFKLGKRAGFYSAFTFIMNNHGALFGLFGFVFAYFNKGADNKIEGIEIVVM